MKTFNTIIFFVAGAVLIYTAWTTPGLQPLHSFTGGFLIGMGVTNTITMWFDNRISLSMRVLVPCDECGRKVPNDLINALVENDGKKDMCAVCGLKAMNKAMGLPEDAPFSGRLAKRFYKLTVKHYKKTKQL